jgi:hypothetical protein
MAVIQLERDWFFSSINSCCRERPRSTNNNTKHKEEVVQKKKDAVTTKLQSRIVKVLNY